MCFIQLYSAYVRLECIHRLILLLIENSARSNPIRPTQNIATDAIAKGEMKIETEKDNKSREVFSLFVQRLSFVFLFCFLNNL